MHKFATFALAALLLVLHAPTLARADETTEQLRERIAALEARLNHMEWLPVPHDSRLGALMILYGAFCALWAQNSGRSPWLWFFLGLVFSFIAVIFLLIKNADDRRKTMRRLRLPPNV